MKKFELDWVVWIEDKMFAKNQKGIKNDLIYITKWLWSLLIIFIGVSLLYIIASSPNGGVRGTNLVSGIS